MKSNSKVFLVGFMGCGKSTLGKKLARKLNKEFIDLDDFIEEQEKLTINEIFEQVGEAGFRALENKWLKFVSQKYDNAVISCGGGTPCFNGNMNFMLEKGKVVYIQLPPKVLCDRLTNERQKRPLIAKLSDNELLEFIKTKLSERSPYYLQSSILFDPLGETEVELMERL